VSEEHPPVQELQHAHTKRDAETQMVLGAFIIYISIPVLIGTIWADTPHTRVVNVVAGSVLCGIGIAMALIGYRGYRRLKNKKGK
jgi:hypothetical protein